MQSLSDGRWKWVTKLSSAGLIYLHFGHRILADVAGYVNRSCIRVYMQCEDESV